ncbi:LysR family transcriptional regulator [Aeromicrobium sp.]|uniref:LysR family transcriptional regulator n=1 Tax=Aeromicrobium sp. TaxID=1871063 RepID=UPI0025BF5899|nr:LysR family transcriptional regulator [Aeromicrobium sp.]MCK5892309.1 LysR family transcriptional regulator [Aeromicrobium sp.]
MQVQQLRYFVAVAQTRHFTRAAELTGVSQPSMSKQIRVLENSLGTPLFVRNRGAIDLTSAGEALLPHAERILIDVEVAEEAVQEVAGLRRGRVRLGATPSLCDGLLPEVLTAFHRRRPGIDLEVHESGSRLLMQELARGHLDLALNIVSATIEHDGLVTTELLTEQLVLVGPPHSELAAEVALRDLRDVPLVMAREGYDLRDRTNAACREAGFDPVIAVEGGEMSAVLRFVEAGLGHAIVPQMVVATRPQLAVARLVSPTLTRTIGVSHRDEQAMSLAARAFRDELVRALG